MKKFCSNHVPLGRYSVLLLRMKLILILIFAFQISLSAKSQAGFSLNIKEASLEEVLETIKSQSDYEFFYSHEEVLNVQPISVSLEDASIGEVLASCLKDSGLGFEVIDNVIVIKPVEKPVEKEAIPVEAPQKKQVSGKVTSSEDGLGIPGVTILLKGTVTGVTTDMDGNYTMQVPDENAVLVFSSVGFEMQEIAVGANTVINVQLESSLTEIDEVIVTALGTTVRIDQTATTNSVVQARDMERSGESGVINALSGKASGVQIRRTNGDPGAGSSIQIRGANTIYGDSQPLIIVDGTPLSNDNIAYGAELSQQSRLDDINANDIASVQILKGASAAAVWGSRAANGVVVITTKSGRLNQKPNVQYSYTKSFDMISVKMPLQSTYGQGRGGVWSASYAESWGDKIADRSGAADELNTSGDYFVGDNTGTTYYRVTGKNSKAVYTDSNYDQVFQTGGFDQHNISVSGGGKTTSYYIGFERFDQEGIIRNFTLERNNARINTQTNIYDWLKFNNKFSYTSVKSNRVQQAGDNTNGAVLGLYRNAPDFDVTDYKGQYVSAAGEVFERQRSYRRHLGENINPTYNNPLWSIYEQEMPDEVEHFFLSPELEINPTDWIKFIVRGGLDFYNDNRIEFFPVGSASGSNANGRMEQQDITSKEVNADAIAIIDREITEDISVSATFGVNYNDRYRTIDVTSVSPFAVNSRLQSTALAGGAPEATSWNKTINHIRSNRGYGVLTFSLFDQLYITTSGTVEAASSIKGNFFYPSADLAWQFTDFIESKLLSFGKIRASWGKVGIQPAPYKFQTLATAGLSDFGGAYAFDSEKGSKELSPEIKTEWEVGTNLRFIEDRISLDFTYYNNETTGILFAVKTNPSSGYSFNYKNAATMSNKGIEIDLGGRIIDQKDFQVKLNTNFNRNRNNVDDIAGAETVDTGGTSKIVKGYPVSSFYMPGTLRDDNGEMILDANGFPQLDTDNRVLGDPNPDWRGGLGFDVNYKNFDLSVLFEHSQGGDYINRTNIVLYGFGKHEDVSHEVTLTEDLVNHSGEVIPAGSTVRGNIEDFGGGNVLLDETWYRQSIGGGLGFSKANDLFLDDASWTKLRNLTLGYTFNKVNITQKFAIKSLRVSVTGRDLFLWTKVRDVDPETNNYGVSIVSGMNYFNNPGTRSVLFNLQLNL
nr:SusC/RagA family TonB-linked outer membrane protein [uncultured Draconibacterium sp.]